MEYGGFAKRFHAKFYPALNRHPSACDRRYRHSHREDLPRCKVGESARIRRVVAGIVAVREIIQPRIQRKVIKVWEQPRSRIEIVTGSKIVEVRALLPVIGIDERFVPE